MMFGHLIVFSLSWPLLRRVAHESTAVLGIAPSKRRLVEFLVGMLIKSIVAVRACLLSSLVFGIDHWFSH